MGFETMPTSENNSEEVKVFEDTMERISEELKKNKGNQEEIKRLNDEFITLWKKDPKGISDKTCETIDEIKEFLEEYLKM